MNSGYLGIFGQQTSETTEQKLINGLSDMVVSRSGDSKDIFSMVISTESLQDVQRQQVANTYSSIETSLKSMVKTLSLESNYNDNQIASGAVGFIMTADPKAFMGMQPQAIQPMGNSVVVSQNLSDGSMKRYLSTESYDERDNKRSQYFSVIYNMKASRQDEFGEVHFPTIMVAPDQAGVTIEIDLFYVIEDVKRSTTGALTDFRRRNIIRAYVDPTILKNDGTRVVPVLRPTSVSNFVDPADVAPYIYNLEGVDIQTAPLKIGASFGLIGLSQPDELLASGLMDYTDSLDTFIQLKNLYLKFTDGTTTDIVSLDVSDQTGATFTYAPQGNTRNMILNMDTNSVILKPATTKHDGSALTYLTEIAANTYNIRMNIIMSGNVTLNDGKGSVFGNKVITYVIRDAAGNLVDQTTAPAAALVAKLNAGTIIGYDLTAYRANVNRRQRGQLTDSQRFFEIINLPYRSPATTVLPVNEVDRNDGTVVNKLVTLTNIRTSNEAVRALLDYELKLKSFEDVRDLVGNPPEILGIGRHYVIPTYFTENIDMSLIVDSRTSFERIRDVRAAIVEKLRYYAYEMYRMSEIQPALDAIYSGMPPKLTVNIGTDPVIYNYLMADGELRTLGEKFNCNIVCTNNITFRNRLIMTFSVADESRNTKINPLNFGNMLWSPEVTVVLPITRDGQMSKELSVSPRFVHLCNSPIMTGLTITNLPSVANKIAVNTKVV